MADTSSIGKQIDVVEVKIGDLREMNGNPRKCTNAKKEELRKSLEMFGDFSIIVIDEKYRIISGHQRVDAMQTLYGNEHKVLCKMLIGYTEPELKAINIKANTHAGEFDLDKLAAWTADLQIDLGLDLPEKNAEEHKIQGMEPIHYEKYDYVVIACRNTIDYNYLIETLGIEGKKELISPKNGRKIQCRAIWYEDLKCKIKK